jgi:hypothetical protein
MLPVPAEKKRGGGAFVFRLFNAFRLYFPWMRDILLSVSAPVSGSRAAVVETEPFLIRNRAGTGIRKTKMQGIFGPWES